MNMKGKVIDTKSCLIRDKVIESEFPIQDIVNFDDCCVLLLDIPEGHVLVSRNVLSYDVHGNELWRIEPDSFRPKFPYVSISKEERVLKATNFSTNQMVIDPYTGEVIRTIWVR